MITPLSFLQATYSQPLATTDWPQFGRTPTFQSAATSSKSSVGRHGEWVRKGAADRLVASPAIHNGTAYYGSDDGHMYAATPAASSTRRRHVKSQRWSGRKRSEARPHQVWPPWKTDSARSKYWMGSAKPE